jgi:hypothetical protein
MASALEGVKPGDTIRCPRRHPAGADLHQVVRLTATRVVCGAASFSIKDGLLIGSADSMSGRRYGLLATAAEIESIALQNRIVSAQQALSRVKVSADNLAAAEALVEASKPKEG